MKKVQPATRVVEQPRVPMMTIWNITGTSGDKARILLLYGKSVRAGESIRVPASVTSAQGGLLAGLIADNQIYIGDQIPAKLTPSVPRARVRGARTH